MPTEHPSERRRSRPTILLVEDDPKIVSFLEKGFRREGFRMEWVSTGTEALARLEQKGIDVQVLDLGLPDIDGLEVLREMRRRGIEIPVIVVTGRTDPRDRAVALSQGVRAYLTKPFPWAVLLAEINAAIDPERWSRTGEAAETPEGS
jgi:DNA-binding response OmpR family regulator